ncbi:hypothetical protein KR026_008160 [Drosophila bipectinata]|nr:hypothetical protein KR026_008160 [Drosophila bipectinata]
MDNIYHQDHQVRVVTSTVDEMTQFIRGIYYRAVPFICVTVTVWLLLSALGIELYSHLLVPFYVPLILAFLTLMVLHCIPQTAMCFPCNWILACFVVVMVTLGGAQTATGLGTLTLFLAVLGVTALVLILNFSGAMCPQEFLPGGVISTLLMIVLLIALVAVGIAQLCTGSQKVLDAFVSILFVMLIIAIPIQAQFNHGRLDAIEVVPEQHLIVCALTVYLHSVMFFSCVCYFIKLDEKKSATAPTTTPDY